jgi:hypothetical protein
MPQNIADKLSRPREERRQFIDPLAEAVDILSETGYEIKREIISRLMPRRK